MLAFSVRGLAVGQISADCSAQLLRLSHYMSQFLLIWEVPAPYYGSVSVKL